MVGQYLVLNADGETQFLDTTANWQSVAEFPSTTVFDMRVSPDGQHVAVAHGKGVTVINVARLEPLEIVLPVEDERSSTLVDKVGFSNDGRRLAFAGSKATNSNL